MKNTYCLYKLVVKHFIFYSVNITFSFNTLSALYPKAFGIHVFITAIQCVTTYP